jgi:hypothetical protein
MAADPTDGLASRLLEGYFCKALDACLTETLASRATGLANYLDRYKNFRLIPVWVGGHGLVVFRPVPGCDGFLDVGESLLLVLTLRHTSGQCRAFGNYATIFCFVELDVKEHVLSYRLLTALTMLAGRTGRTLQQRREACATRPKTPIQKLGHPTKTIEVFFEAHVRSLPPLSL